MLLSNLFNLPTFQAVQLTAVVERIAYQPSMLGAFGPALFTVSSSSTRQIAMAQSEGVLALIPTSPIGAPPVELEKKPSDLRSFIIHRLAKGSTLMAESLTGLMLAPDFQQIAMVQQELADRSAKIRTDLEFTQEFMRLGAVLGRVLDADGSVLDDFWQTWGVPLPAWIDFPLNDPAANLRMLLRQLTRDVERSSQGGWIPGRTQLHALCGAEFYERLLTHPKVEATYLNWSAAMDLRAQILDQFPFGGVIWHDYRGTDDGTTMAIAGNEAHFFPVGANEAFRQIWGPAEFDPFINLPGRDIYALDHSRSRPRRLGAVRGLQLSAVRVLAAGHAAARPNRRQLNADGAVRRYRRAHRRSGRPGARRPGHLAADASRRRRRLRRHSRRAA